ncbi:MAG: hypothetical protein HC850_01245 [Rhodomicrobium sp.]|nr:hypothetical protein [Rhodomicrobium sp.]
MLVQACRLAGRFARAPRRRHRFVSAQHDRPETRKHVRGDEIRIGGECAVESVAERAMCGAA